MIKSLMCMIRFRLETKNAGNFFALERDSSDFTKCQNELSCYEIKFVVKLCQNEVNSVDKV